MALQMMDTDMANSINYIVPVTERRILTIMIPSLVMLYNAGRSTSRASNFLRPPSFGLRPCPEVLPMQGSPLSRLAHLRAHLGVLFLEALAEARLHEARLLHAARYTARLPRRQGLGGEVVNARVEAVVDQVAEELRGRRNECQSRWFLGALNSIRCACREHLYVGAGKRTASYSEELLHLTLLQALLQLAGFCC